MVIEERMEEYRVSIRAVETSKIQAIHYFRLSKVTRYHYKSKESGQVFISRGGSRKSHNLWMQYEKRNGKLERSH